MDVAAPRGVDGQQQVVGLVWRRRDPEAAEDLRQVRGLNVAVPAGELVEERLGELHEIVVRVHRPIDERCGATGAALFCGRRCVKHLTGTRPVRAVRAADPSFLSHSFKTPRKAKPSQQMSVFRSV